MGEDKTRQKCFVVIYGANRKSLKLFLVIVRGPGGGGPLQMSEFTMLMKIFERDGLGLWEAK